MAEAVVSVCWKDHTNEIATQYRSLLDNNFLADCTISAEGQSLKAHRLILSACSPYFHMLFGEETGKHPFVILLDASFETLKSVVDFVYRGETRISERNLKPFLTLSQSLQIKGLNAFLKDYNNKSLCCITTEDVCQCPSEDSQTTCEVESICGSHEDYSQKHSDQLVGGTYTVNKSPSVPCGDDSALCEQVQSVSVMLDHQRSLRCDEMSVDSEITVKHEPFYSVFLETGNEELHNFKSEETMSGNCMNNVNGGIAVVSGEENLNQLSSCSGVSHGNVVSSVMPPSQQQLMQLNNKVCSGYEVVEREELLLPVILVPKSEQMDDGENEEPVDDPDVPGNDTSETEEVSESVHSVQNPGQSLSAVDFPSTQNPDGHQWRSQQEMTSASTSEVQMRAGPHARKPLLRCRVCPATFTSPDDLKNHKHLSTGERPFGCDMCGKTFTSASSLARHTRVHTGERPYKCKVCGKAFREKTYLSTHMHTHTGERPYSCDVCGKDFSSTSDLTRHKRLHSGERQHRCDVCGNTFARADILIQHSRIHTGERPHCCDVCGDTFTGADILIQHARIHTGARPHRCVCGMRYKSRNALLRHKRTHAESRHEADPRAGERDAPAASQDV